MLITWRQFQFEVVLVVAAANHVASLYPSSWPKSDITKNALHNQE